MTLRLILTRHAKSSWDDPLAEDHSRILNARGINAAKTVGHWLTAKKYVPDLVLCSTAERTRETWGLINNELNATSEVRFEKGLYLASPDLMLSELNNAASESTVMVLGHNPSIGLLASGLAAKPSLHPQSDRYPSGATMILDFDVADWGNVTWGSGVVVDFVVPKELETGH
ncbi:MAG: SixA phosphatase family protein [Paracoccaceae bacterium]